MSFFNALKESAANLINSDSFNSLSKTVIIEKVAALDYQKIYDSINLLEQSTPSAKKVLPVINALELASTEYNESDSITKDDDFINFLTSCLDAEAIVSELEPIIGMIPMGNIIMMILRYIINMKK